MTRNNINATVNGKKGTYDVRTNVTIVDESKTSYYFDTNATPTGGKQGSLTPQGTKGKTVALSEDAGLGIIAHETMHFAGARDGYTTVDVDGVTTSVPNPGFSGNLMGDPSAIANFGRNPNRTSRSGNFFNGTNVGQILSAPTSPHAGFRNGVTVGYE